MTIGFHDLSFYLFYIFIFTISRKQKIKNIISFIFFQTTYPPHLTDNIVPTYTYKFIILQCVKYIFLSSKIIIII